MIWIGNFELGHRAFIYENELKPKLELQELCWPRRSRPQHSRKF